MLQNSPHPTFHELFRVLGLIPISRQAIAAPRRRGALVRSGLSALLLVVAISSGCAHNKGNAEVASNNTHLAEDANAEQFVHDGASLSTWTDLTGGISRHGPFPRAAEDCSVIYDPLKHQLILFGGKNDADENLNELWALDLKTRKWLQLEEKGERPPASEDHITLYDPIGKRMILHGGENGPTWNQTWSLDLVTYRWTNLTTPKAPSLENHTAIYDSRRKMMVLFGGWSNDDTDLYEIWGFGLDPGSPLYQKWLDLTIDQNHPPGRLDHVAVYDSLRDRMIIFGGWSKDARKFLNDTWAFYFKKMLWRKIKTRYSHPNARRHMVGVFAADRNWMLIYGGFGNRGYLNDVWAFDLTNEAWINITPGPQPRIDHQAIYDPVTKSMIVYGGDAHLHAKFHDVWQMKIYDDIPERELIAHAKQKK